MLNSRIRTIKIYFLALSGLAVLLFLVGIVALKDNPYLSGRYMASWLTNWKYRFEYTSGNGVALASDIVGNRRTYVSTDPSTPAVPVLVYHGVGDTSEGEYTVSTENFKEQMFALKRAGYRTITLRDYLAYIRGEKKVPPKSFMLTFDDGRKDAYYNGDPILKAVGFNAVMFAITRYSLDANDSSYYLSADELRQMERSGRWEVEVHTHNGHGMVPIDAEGHVDTYYANKAWLIGEDRLETDEEYRARIETDLAAAKAKIEETVGHGSIGFAIPFGDYGQVNTNYASSSEVLLGSAGKLFPLIFYQFGNGDRIHLTSYNPLRANDPYFLVRRIDTDASWDGDGLMRALERMMPKALPYSDDLSSNRGWVPAWGVLTIGRGRLAMSGANRDTGAAAVLDGSGGWKDYEVKATLNDPGRDGAFMWVRFKDELNTAGCNFGNGFLHIVETVNGKQNVIKGVRDPSIAIPGGEFTVTARVKGRRIECSLGLGMTISTEFLDPSLNMGGIGFKTWDKDNEVKLVIRSIEARDLSAVDVRAASRSERILTTGSVPVAQ